jgi:hypothetical protein
MRTAYPTYTRADFPWILHGKLPLAPRLARGMGSGTAVEEVHTGARIIRARTEREVAVQRLRVSGDA